MFYFLTKDNVPYMQVLLATNLRLDPSHNHVGFVVQKVTQ